MSKRVKLEIISRKSPKYQIYNNIFKKFYVHIKIKNKKITHFNHFLFVPITRTNRATKNLLTLKNKTNYRNHN